MSIVPGDKSTTSVDKNLDTKELKRSATVVDRVLKMERITKTGKEHTNMRNVDVVERAVYGKSMYGGWYAESVVPDENMEWISLHADTLKELREQAKENGLVLYSRYDN